MATRATRRNPACSRTLALLRSAYEPWDVLRRHVWPRSFRERMGLVHRSAGKKMQGITFLILSYCQWCCFQMTSFFKSPSSVYVFASVISAVHFDC